MDSISLALTRRRLLALLATPVFAGLVAACSDDTKPTDTTLGSTSTTPDTSGSRPTADEARSDLQRIERAVDVAVDAKLDASITYLGEVIWDGLVTESPDKNMVFSSASVAIALAMAAAGAKGDTAKQMYDLLDADPASLNGALNALTADLARINDSGALTSELVNSLWGQQGFAFNKPYLDELATEYGAGMNLVDYKTDPEDARKQINAWVDTATHKRIPELIPAKAIDNLMRLVLVNTIYLKADWATPFIPELTDDADFTTLDGSATKVKMMRREAFFGYAAGDGWTAVELPYVGDELSMVLVLDDDTSTQQPKITEVGTALANTKVDLSLPRFQIDTAAELSKLLAGAGAPLPFDPDDADFSGITAEERLYIGFVIHQANITAGEDGTEAAAATAMGMPAGAAPGTTLPPKRVTFDRPFSFWIRHRPTNVPLFIGRVVDPSAQ